MKKLFSLILCFALILCITSTAYAAETDNSTIVSLTVPDETYTLTIPANVTIDPATKSGTVMVSFTDVNLIWSKGIEAYFTCANAISGEDGSYLVNSDSGKKVHYNLYDENGDMYGSVTPGYAGNNTTEGSIHLEVDGAYPGAGTYTDTLTFSVRFY